jgi:hypothetical protein
MFLKPLKQINKSDIEDLIRNRVVEQKTLEYKRDLPETNDDAKKEFLADVSSFANASGGDIIYGVEEGKGENKGTPIKVVPIIGTTIDQAKQRLENMIQSGIAPRLRFEMQEIMGWGDNENSFILVLRIPRSFNAPHMVTFKHSSRFYARNSSGKAQLDVHEIRSAFLAANSHAQRIKEFREERLGRILADETPVVLSSPPRLVLHVIPMASFLNGERLSLSRLGQFTQNFPMIEGGGRLGCTGSGRYNLDGVFIAAGSGSSAPARRYCQIFFNGAIESVCCGSILANPEQKYISSSYEEGIINVVKSYLMGYENLGLSGPIAVSLALLGCKGMTMYVNSEHQFLADHEPCDRENLVLPDVVVEEMNAMDVEQELKPLFDNIWNAFGYEGSLYYDSDGKWKGTS